ncbi:MAG: hypothetical protein Q8N18_00290 [Opitutaceae bacterium]|nr:hypothetical protein [Opitutaceae bacterium]
MSNPNAGGDPNNEWEDRGDVAWNEFDWERYLREQDAEVDRYVQFYEACKDPATRIDDVAERMEWGEAGWVEEDEADDEEEDDDDDVYTLHKNPIYIATKGIYLVLTRSWRKLADDPARVPPSLALALFDSFQRGQDLAMQAVHALDFGDYAMAVSLFKRALSALNASFALINADAVGRLPQLSAWREEAQPRFFDLREVWLRVIAECREELERPIDEEE